MIEIHGTNIFVYMKKDYCGGYSKDDIASILLSTPSDKTMDIKR